MHDFFIIIISSLFFFIIIVFIPLFEVEHWLKFDFNMIITIY